MIEKADGVKVGCGSALRPGAEVSSAKPSGSTNMNFSSVSGGNLAKQLVRKRAYRRALIRAQHNGTTMYRGRCVTAQQAAWYQAPTLIKVNRNLLDRNASRWRPGRGPRLRICSQNLGGICAATYDGFCNWLNTCPYDMVFIQEVHFGLGRESSQWSDRHWHTIVSVDPGTRFSGVAVFIRKTFAHDDCIRFNEIIKGRLLHVRIFPSVKQSNSGCSVDVLCAYQHAGDDDRTMQGGRQQFWTSLSRSVSTMPRRNMLIVAGDFNCTPPAVPGLTGNGHICPDRYRADAHEFQELLRIHDLCALNTWTSPRRCNMYTFQMQDRRAQIDYIFTRRAQADYEARLAKPLWGHDSIDHSPWRGGSKHMALRCSLPLFPGWRTDKISKPGGNSFDKHALEAAVKHNTAEAQCLRDAVRARLAEAGATVENINNILLQCTEQIFPGRAKQTRPKAWQDSQVRASVLDLWRNRRCFLDASHVMFRLAASCPSADEATGAHHSSVLHAAFGCWKAHLDLQKTYKELQRRGRAKRRQFLEDRLAQAKLASERHDTKELYAIVRQLAPKQKRRSVRIRQLDGSPLNAEAEFEAIKEYFGELYSQDNGLSFSFPVSAPSSGLIEITSREVSVALKANKLGKSVPVDHAPTGAWIACAELPIITEAIAEAATACVNGERPVLQRWSDCHLALIPKPNKSLCRPENLRPLGIQDVAGKSFARILKTKLLSQIGDKLKQYPQFAYVAGRSTEGAIARIIEHCGQVRDDLGHAKRNVFSKRLKQAVLPAVGGIQLSVDMSTAFDRVPRTAMRHALIWAGASRELVEVIDQLHAQCHYHIRHAGFSGEVGMHRGVRQGCTLAPILFATYSCFLAEQIGQRTNMDWMKNSLTLYADDTHAAWTVRCAADFDFVEHCIQAIYSVFIEFGMKVNPLKSVVVCSLQGRLSKLWCRQKIQKTSRGNFLCIGPVHNLIRIPIHSSMVYLGVVASYAHYELQTMKHRLQIARASRQRLIKILHSSRHLGVHKRLELYMACVRSSATYGLNAVGHTHASLNLLRKFEQKHVRAIARSPSHIYRETTAALCARLGILEPDVALLSILEAQCKRITRLGLDVEEWRLVSKQVLQEYIMAKHSGIQAVAIDKSCPCPTCGIYFANRSAMRQHHMKMHKVSLVPDGKQNKDVRNRVVIYEHSVDGMPICKHCGKKFENFSTLKAHVLDCGVLPHQGCLGLMTGPWCLPVMSLLGRHLRGSRERLQFR